ncbi:MAG: hypothetical protein U0822_27305 [Anaerolineae bacterium]
MKKQFLIAAIVLGALRLLNLINDLAALVGLIFLLFGLLLELESRIAKQEDFVKQLLKLLDPEDDEKVAEVSSQLKARPIEERAT